MASKPMRLLLVIPGLESGDGSERSTLELVPKLVDVGIDVSVAYMEQRPTAHEAEWRDAGARLHLISERRLEGRVRRIRRLIASSRPHIIHTALYEADLAGRLAAWRAPACSPVVLSSLVNTSYDLVRLADPNVRAWKLHAVRLADGWTARHLTDHFHAVSHAVKSAAIQSLGIDSNRVTVIERGRDPGRLGEPSRDRRGRVRTALELAQDAKVIVTIGRQEFQKGHVDLVDAFDLVAARQADAELLLVGREGHQSREIRGRVGRSPFRNRIRILGHRDDVPDLLAAADVFVLPSLYEGFPGAVIEAMALALPVVASDLPPLRELVEDGRSGLLVPSRSAERLAEAMGRVLSEPDLQRRFGEHGRQAFLTRLTADQSHRRMIDLYHQLAPA